MEAPGRLFLKINGILMMIGGLVGGLIAALGIIGYNNLDPTMVADMEKIMPVPISVLMGSMIVELVAGVILLMAGIIGIVFAKDKGKAKYCFFGGIFSVCFRLIAFVYSGVNMGFSVMGVIGLVLGLIVPGLFLRGALKNLRA